MAEAEKTAKERMSKHALQQKLREKHADHKTRSARYLALEEKSPGTEPKTLEEAIALVKETSNTKFDSSVELHIHLTAKKGKKGTEDEYARGVLHLPHGIGKERKVVILTEDKVEELAKTQKIDFDVAIATPALMPKLGKVAKLLGTKGKMPNPKAGTVTEKPEEMKAEIEAGRVEYRQDAGRNIHQMIGKASWDARKLIENAQTVIKLFTANRIGSITLTSTMGPSVKVVVEKK